VHPLEATSLFGFVVVYLWMSLKQPLLVAHLVEKLYCLGFLASCVVVIFSLVQSSFSLHNQVFQVSACYLAFSIIVSLYLVYL
jgi:hypothetical protein